MAAPDSCMTRAAQNIATAVGRPPAGSALVICSSGKAALAGRVGEALDAGGVPAHVVRLSPERAAGLADMVRRLAPAWGLVLLIEPPDAGWLFETVGRPDTGILVPDAHLFCDWVMRPDALLRTCAVDMVELSRFREGLLAALTGVGHIRVTTGAGTDLTVMPRHWNATDGEVFTAPVEYVASGVIVVDGCAYSGPPERPFTLRIERGRVANGADLRDDDPQQRMAAADLSRDEHANVLAELGIGINPGALWNADVMEAEQARGTCHFGFGGNVSYGGQVASSYHFDLVIRHPTITVDGRVLCRRGVWML
ncbi:MAG: hypothetical protein ACOX9A_03765 [Anaerolineae bacterium]